MHYWLLKTEPASFSVEDLAAAPRRTTAWDGVRNYQARNMLRDQMKRGDQAFLYYSSTEVPGIVAILQIWSGAAAAWQPIVRHAGGSRALEVHSVARVMRGRSSWLVRVHSPRAWHVRLRAPHLAHAGCARL